jgi:hypothetical protein
MDVATNSTRYTPLPSGRRRRFLLMKDEFKEIQLVAL